MAYARGLLKADKRGLLDSPHFEDMQPPNENFGKQVYMTAGSPQAWNEFGDTMVKQFADLDLTVDRKKIFPSDVHLTSSADRDIPFGRGRVQTNPHVDSEPRDMYERDWLEANTGMNWEIKKWGGFREGLLRAMGKFSGDPIEGHLVTTREGAVRSRPSQGLIAKGGEQEIVSPIESDTGHEYGHYLDMYLSSGDIYLSDVVSDMINELGGFYSGVTQKKVYNYFMNDPRTAHLDVEDKVNQQTPFAQNNPREILGKLYTTALLESEGSFKNVQENIARALGAMFGEQTKKQGHGKKITDQKRDVMGALANILNQ